LHDVMPDRFSHVIGIVGEQVHGKRNVAASASLH
jgi:hypothetical protein